MRAVGEHLDSKTFTLSIYKSEKRGTVLTAGGEGLTMPRMVNIIQWNMVHSPKRFFEYV